MCRATVAEHGHAAEILCRAENKMAALARLTAMGGKVSDIAIVQPGLDEVYRHFSPLPPEDARAEDGRAEEKAGDA